MNELAVKIASIAPVAICATLFFFLLLAEEKRLINEVVDEHSRPKRRRDLDDEKDSAHAHG
jgi:hypothetical protein